MAWYWMYLTRLTTLLDTMFLVGRKKFHKITTTHVLLYSYTTVHFWIHARYAAGGHGTLDMIQETSTLLMMHFHYVWISLGPSSNIWFKQHITTLQIMQMLFNIFREVAVLWMASSCDFPWQITILSFSLQFLCCVHFILSYLALYVGIDKL